MGFSPFIDCCFLLGCSTTSTPLATITKNIIMVVKVCVNTNNSVFTNNNNIIYNKDEKNVNV